MSTEAAGLAPGTAEASTGSRLDTANGSMVPRSALDVLVDLNDKVTTGNVGEYQPVRLGSTPMDKTIGAGLRAGELLLIGGAQGTGKPRWPCRWPATSRRGPGERPLYLLRAR